MKNKKQLMQITFLCLNAVASKGAIKTVTKTTRAGALLSDGVVVRVSVCASTFRMSIHSTKM